MLQIAIDDADSIIRSFHLGLQTGDHEKLLAVGLPTGLDQNSQTGQNGTPEAEKQNEASVTVA